MFDFLRKPKLVRDHLKGMAKLMYQDVSEDAWDQENLTKRNLDFTIESMRFIDVYAKKLMETEIGKELLHKHFGNFVVRIGAYIGEVIRNEVEQDFHWYELDSVYQYSPSLKQLSRQQASYSLLYSKKRDTAIFPLDEAEHFLKGNSVYPNLLSYAETMVKKNR